ncbi:MAG TPA: prenyltransferase/squalene oxidase repeat-containing protein [Thermoleophilaceae bacterium]|nr:prenyltransferase/squalene oxidase repeat-containing protein [Thermoleophilaceae bacterium]
MSWEVSSLALLGLALAAGFAWYEREQPPARVLAVVAALAALAVVGRLAFAAIPNVKPTTDIVLFAGYALGAVPGFAVGAVTAIVSNIFLSQGPWTVWQMAGWGAVGVGGAVLARVLRGREPNRFVLAAVCGVAGLLFGAWMDIYQWTFAARQDLDTYLAVSATSLPYNVAHAVGNVVFCLLLGPAFLRALARYRRRLEVRWERSPAPIVASLVVLALVLAVPAVAAAATPAKRAQSYLLHAQNKDGGFGAAPKLGSSPLYSGWAGLGLASAGRNPRDVKRSGGRSAAAYVLRGSASLRDIGEIERTVLVARVAGMDPRHFGGRDLLAEIEKRRRGDGSISGFVSYTAFGVIALRASGASAGSATVRWLVGSQNDDGGFGVARASTSDADMTGAALQALATVGRAHGKAAQRAADWLRANQNGDGGFGQFKGRSSNAQSTSYAVQGLAAAGSGAAAVSRAQSYLVRLQRSDGSVGYSSSSAQTPVWVTAQALMAIEGKALPLAVVPRSKRSRAKAAAGGGGGASAPGGGGKAGSKPGKGGGAAAAGGVGAAADGGAAAGAVGGATAGAPTATDPEATSALAAAPESGAAHPKPVPVWAGLLAAAGLLALLWVIHRYVLPGRFPGMG